MSIHENTSLKPYNTFGIDVQSDYFTTVSDKNSLHSVLTDPRWEDKNKLILGEGSNILFTQNFKGLVIQNKITGIEHLGEDGDHVWLKVGAGENWHQFVLHCIKNNYAGIENLSLIPGTVGAAPIQNIGAYGVEAKETIDLVDVISMNGKTSYTMRKADCQFGYRDSVFKNGLKNKCVITHVTFRLNKKPIFHTNYGTIQQTLEKNNVKELSIKAISDSIIQIRQQKLPDPKKIGNAGSFFKNPIISLQAFKSLQQQYPNMPFYTLANDQIKLPAAWLIEQCGFKGKRFDESGVHHMQPLVLVNHGKSTGNAIKSLSETIKQAVWEKFSVALIQEVTIY